MCVRVPNKPDKMPCIIALYCTILQLVCIIVPEEGDIAAFKSLSEADLGGTAPSATPAAPSPAPAAAAAPSGGAKKTYPDHIPGKAFLFF